MLLLEGRDDEEPCHAEAMITTCWNDLDRIVSTAATVGCSWCTTDNNSSSSSSSSSRTHVARLRLIGIGVLLVGSMMWSTERRRLDLLEAVSGGSVRQRRQPNDNDSNSNSSYKYHESFSAMPRRHHNPDYYRTQTGSWVGDIWYPPDDWTVWTVSDLQDIYMGASMFWHGDSTARRASASFYVLLNTTTSMTNRTTNSSSGSDIIAASTTIYSPPDITVAQVSDSSVVDINMDENLPKEICHRWNDTWYQPNVCRPLPGGGDFRTSGHRKGDCYRHLNDFLESELRHDSNVTDGMDLLIVAQGVWEGVGKAVCTTDTFGRDYGSILNETLSTVETFVDHRPNVKVVWRTTGFSVNTVIANTTLIHQMNELVMDRIDAYAARQRQPSRLMYVNWAGAIEPRSFGRNRIVGDTPEHYGFAGRFVAIQMITNRLVDYYKDVDDWKRKVLL